MNKKEKQNNFSFTKFVALSAAVGAGIYTINKVLTENTIRHVSVLENDSANGEKCVICLETFEPKTAIKQLKCSHKFHVDCIDNSIRKNSLNCPLCRARI